MYDFSKTNQKGRLRIIVLGLIVRAPIGGLTWHYLQYVMGLADLGHEVFYLEDSDDYDSCYDPSKHRMSADFSYGINYTKQIFDRVGLGNSWSYYDTHTSKWYGPCAEKIDEICKHADLLINISEVNPMRPWFANIPKRVLIDTDPAFNQVRHLTIEKMRKTALEHNAFFSFGENIPGGLSNIPDDGFDWQPTRQPIFLKAWIPTPGYRDGNFTTVMQWDSYDGVNYNGVNYGLKSKMFKQFFDLPTKTKETLELALGSAEAPRERLTEIGWKLKDPLAITKSPQSYQDYIQQSKAEFSIAKHGYVVSNCGWFSERSAAYLASGRPILVQDTGFGNHIETGKGLLTFNSEEEALEGIEKINKDYEMHCKYARQVTEEFFDSKKVLTSFLAMLS